MMMTTEITNDAHAKEYNDNHASNADDDDGHFCEVEYNIYNENQTVADTRRGRLFPNVKGCGYPPIVECDGKKQHF